MTVCDRVYRRGENPPKPSAFTADKTGNEDGVFKTRARTWPRQIVVGFIQGIDKASVFRNLNKLKGNDRWNGVYLGNDYTDCQRNEIRNLRALTSPDTCLLTSQLAVTFSCFLDQLPTFKIPKYNGWSDWPMSYSCTGCSDNFVILSICVGDVPPTPFHITGNNEFAYICASKTFS